MSIRGRQPKKRNTGTEGGKRKTFCGYYNLFKICPFSEKKKKPCCFTCKSSTNMKEYQLKGEKRK